MATLINQNQVNPPPKGIRRLLGWLFGFSQRRKRHAVEDLLKHIHACQQQGQAASAASAAGAIGWSTHRAVKVIEDVERHGLIRSTSKGLELTEDGKQLAVSVIRAHRLWERYLADEAGMPLSRVHAEANRREHDRDGRQVDQLDAALGHPRHDPHGDPIPTADGRLAALAGKPLTDWPRGKAARITHLEDEPASVFNQIIALGLLPGQTVIVDGATSEGLQVSFDDRQCVVPPVIAGNVFVDAVKPEVQVQPDVRRLSALTYQQDGIISGFDPSLRGFHRRRLLDLGLTPGTPIRAERQSMFRDPKAYRVRGTLVALRREQADKVLIEAAPANVESRTGVAS